MSEPFIGEIRMVGFNFAPRNWAACDGQLLPIAQNQALFSLLGTTFGGNGEATFALPDLRGRAPMHFGNGPGLTPHQMGEQSGTETVTLLQSQMQAHGHTAYTVSGDGTEQSPAGGLWAHEAGHETATYAGQSDAAMSASAITQAGASQPHENRQPLLAVNMVICLYGIFPSRN